MPLGLSQQGPRLYLVCRFRNFENERSRALHRIIAARALTLTLDRPKDFNLQQYDDDGRFGFGEGNRIRLTFEIEKTAGRNLLESRLPVDKTVQDLSDHIKITASVVYTAVRDWWLGVSGRRSTKWHGEP